eukprot:Em0018g795a
METEVDFGSWTLVETVAWAKKAFGDDVSASFEEEGVDGETLELLAKCGTRPVASEVSNNRCNSKGSVTKSKAADSTRSVPKDDLTADTTGSITKGPASDSTVHASAPTGSVSDSTVHASAPTGPASDSTTLIDSGTTGTKSVTKDLPAKEIRSVTMNQATDSTDRESVTTGSIIHVTSNSTESVPKDIASDAIATKCNKDQTGTGPVTKELVADTAALEILSVTSPEDLDQQQEDDIIVGSFTQDFSQKSAEVIISVAFGVMMMKQLTRQRLLTTLNNYMAQGDERRSLQSAPKASLLRPLAKLLLAKKIVVLSEGATLQNVKRQDVKVNGTLMECIGNQEGMHWKPGWNALETRKECIGNQDGMHWKPGRNALETRMECIGNQDGMHWKPGWNALVTRKECIGNQDGMHWKPGWNALETRMECNGNQDGMHWKPGWNALVTRKECIGNQDGMHWKPGWNALETRMECIGNQDGMHWKPGWNALETRMECIGNQDGMQWKPGRNALETRMECIGNQEGMHWKPGRNALETRMKCIGNHRKLGWNVFQTGVGMH